MCRRRIIRQLLAALALGASTQAASADTLPLQVSGYYKNLLVDSRTQPITLDLNRLRLAVKGSLSDNLSLDLQHDNELLLGNYLRTAQFAAQREGSSSQLWNLESNWRETPNTYGRQKLYRASVNLSAGDIDVRFGRQRIAWGTGRFWSPLDLLNPINPLTIEREERLGTDALLVERKFGPLSRASFVWAPGRRGAADSRAFRWHGNAAGTDYSVLLGDIARTRVGGIDLAGQLGQAGWRAEVARFDRPAGRTYSRALFGMDYAFANSLTLTGELYFNGAGSSDSKRYDLAGLAAGRIQSLGRRYAAGHASYEITPLLKAEIDFAMNVDDRSRYVGAALTCSPITDLKLRAGVQRFGGAPGTEFRRVPSTVYFQVQRFF